MRKLLWLIPLVWAAVLLLTWEAWADPWLVCDPQSDATGYIYTLNGGAEVTVPYATQTLSGRTVAVVADLAPLPTGAFTFQVKAYKDDPVWGRLQSASVPFVSSKPSAGSPQGMAIAR